eukprot:snap_masked-scaffold_19-processed-gene-0.17-mRNA-1 protein AED:1.00 eAED:1.00 QI:0/-1/0/0/-1/1/1/0/78
MVDEELSKLLRHQFVVNNIGFEDLARITFHIISYNAFEASYLDKFPYEYDCSIINLQNEDFSAELKSKNKIRNFNLNV